MSERTPAAVGAVERPFPGRGAGRRPSTASSFDIAEGEILALVGESGCGKSVTALSILRCWCRKARPARSPGARSGSDGQDVLALPRLRAMRKAARRGDRR